MFWFSTPPVKFANVSYINWPSSSIEFKIDRPYSPCPFINNLKTMYDTSCHDVIVHPTAWNNWRWGHERVWSMMHATFSFWVIVHFFFNDMRNSILKLRSNLDGWLWMWQSHTFGMVLFALVIESNQYVVLFFFFGKIIKKKF